MSATALSPRSVYAALAAFSVALLGAMGFVLHTGTRVSTEHMPLVRASAAVKLDTTLAHLWFEEILSGDRHESMDEVRSRLATARQNARTMVESGGEAGFLDDPRLRAKILRVEDELSEFEAITTERWKARQTSASGTDVDQAYDAVFREFIVLADEVSLELHELIRRDTRSARRVQWAVIAGAAALLVLVGLLFARYTRERTHVARTLELKVRAEEEAREHLAELAHVVRLTTMSELVAGIAHEINQPLAAISTAAAACRRLVSSGRSQSPEHETALELIESEALRASDVVTRLWEFVDKRESKYDLVDVNHLVRGVIKLGGLDPRIRETAIRLDLAADLPSAEADAVQIQQVLLNLLRNAHEAADGRGGEAEEIVIRTRVDDDGEIEVAVIDHGAGVPDDIAGATFEPFFTTKESGMGMGLSISHSIVSAHGGRIWFHPNERAPGTTFLFTLPAAGRDAF